MTLEEFVELVKKSHISVIKDGKTKYKSKKIDETYSIYNKWCSGGVSGGSCWTDNPTYYPMSGESEPSFDSLDSILTKLCPNMTFVDYNSIKESCDTDTITEYEYYGNSTNYTIVSITLKDLYNKLKEMKYL